MSSAYIPLVFITDEQYIVPTCVSIASVLSSQKEDTSVRIYLLTDGLSALSMQAVNSFCSHKTEINIITANIEKYQNIHHAAPNSYCQATETALLKFAIPNLVPEKKVLYLDGDILCRGDLSVLYHTNLEGHLLGAVMDSGRIYSGRDIFSECPCYFNSGVMLMDLEAMRACNADRHLYEIKKGMTKSKLMDQDVFNLFCKDKVKTLPVKYNLLYTNLLRAQRRYHLEINTFNDLFQTNYRSFSQALTDCIIVHFASKDKPWKDVSSPLRNEWFTMFGELSKYGSGEPFLVLQNKWLLQEVRTLETKFHMQQTEEAGYWEEKYEHIKNSLSYRLGRTATAAPRYLRKQLKKHTILPQKSAPAGPETISCYSKRPYELIVSMTTHGPRIKTAHIALKSILRQSLKPGKIVLCVSGADYRNFTPQLKDMEKKGQIEVLINDDFSSPHMKYFHTMQKYPDAFILTVDDDVIYRNDLIEKLYASYLLFPDCISAMRTHRIRFGEDGNILPYQKWRTCTSEYVLTPRNDLFATGVGGVLYPPHLLPADTFRHDIIEKTCPHADDLWLKVMELRANVKVVLAAPYRALRYAKGTQKDGLFQSNVNQGGNDGQLRNLLAYYGKEQLIEKIIEN